MQIYREVAFLSKVSKPQAILRSIKKKNRLAQKKSFRRCILYTKYG